MNEQEQTKVSFRQLLHFFIPLGISASLVTISHVIINSTLARSAHPELVIASYALPMSILGITEKPAVLLRQTCSALVRDRRSFRAMSLVALYVLGAVFIMGGIVSYTPIGPWIFQNIFGAEEELLGSMMNVYRVLMFVSIFSGIRCMFQGIIIANMRTKWLTISMVIRLTGMYLLSLYFIHQGVESGTVGAVIFLFGMIIEAAASFVEGRSLARKMPEVQEGNPVTGTRQIFGFYRPLLYSSLIAIIAPPAINAMLGKTADITLAVASFAIAANITNLMQSFFSYIHQIVLNFYRKDAATVRKFTLCLAFIPTCLIAVLAYTPVGPWFLNSVMGVSGRLLDASIDTLKVFMLMTLVFPWLDFGNGLLMLRGQTKVMVWSQAGNVFSTLIALILLIIFTPSWNGAVGALAQSLGLAAEAAVVFYVLRQTAIAEGRMQSRSIIEMIRRRGAGS